MKRHILLSVALATAAVAAAQPAGFTEQDAIDFLYDNMTLPDRADRTREFYEANVRSTYEAMRQMPWGATVPEREFKHFVLPVRVNNEDLDMSRPVMFAELRDRVKGMSMSEAILEVNHWCHEHVAYQPSNPRTRGPLATMRGALGRCGEESTFTVAALRSVGIPARQVYTTRWAHTDDNHAWVEAWADGQWHFLGACEPEPVLDLGWFNAPAARGMLMSTNVFGSYDGPEEVLDVRPSVTTINITSNYAPVSDINVQVVDARGEAVPGATVDFCLYNYADFYPVATRVSDSDGRASLLAGHGDMIVWATDGRRYGYVKANAAAPAVVRLDHEPGYTGSDSIDITPPPVRPTRSAVTPAMAAANAARLVVEDSIRGAYTATFATAADAARLAAELSLPSDTLTTLLVAARGNRDVIERFIRDTPAGLRHKALAMMSALESKDLVDVTADVLADHLMTPYSDTPLYVDYILNPRVECEMLTPYRAYFAQELGDGAVYRADPSAWVAWVRENIALADDRNPMMLRMSPASVLRERKADAKSRDIFFVASARSMGIPARIDPVSGNAQYADASGRWVNIAAGQPSSSSSSMSLRYVNTGSRNEPRYYSQFSIARIIDGRPRQLEHAENASISEVSAAQSSTEAGDYMLITGQRKADGGVMCRLEFATLAEGASVEMPVELRCDTTAVQVIGNFNSENIYHDASTGTDRSLLSTTGRGYYVLGIVNPAHEPSSHALNDIAAEREGFEKWGKKVMIMLPDEAALNRFDLSHFGQLPSTAVIGCDLDGALASEVVAALNLNADERPIFIIADTFNRIVYVQQGYVIGLGHKLLDIIGRLEE